MLPKQNHSVLNLLNQVQVWVDKDPSGEGVPVYQVGEGIRIGVNVSAASYVYLYSIKSTGEIQQILPNRFDADGLPSAVTVHGRLYDEGTLVRLGMLLESHTSLAGRRPPLG